MSLSDDWTAFKQWLAGKSPELAADTEGAVAKMETAVNTAADTAVTQLAPTFAPEVIPVLNGLLDDADAKIDADLAAGIADLTAKANDAKAKNAATRQAIAGATQ